MNFKVHIFYLINIFSFSNLLTVYSLPKGDGPQCTAVFSFIGSPVCNLQFSNTGDILAVGFECGQVRITALLL